MGGMGASTCQPIDKYLIGPQSRTEESYGAVPFIVGAVHNSCQVPRSTICPGSPWESLCKHHVVQCTVAWLTQCTLVVASAMVAVRGV